MWLALCISLLAQAPDARVEVIEPGPPGTQYQRSVVHSRDTDYVLVPVPREAPCLVIYISTAGRPVVAQRKCAITIPAAQVGTGGVTDFSVLLTRSAFPDEMCSPTDPNAAQANGGDIRFYSDSALTNRLACDLIAWELDSSDGARDAAIQIRVNVPSLSSVVANTIYVAYNQGEAETQPAAGDAYGQYGAYASSALAYYPAGGGNDRTANGLNLTAAGGVSAGGATGKAGAGTDYDGTDDKYSSTNATVLALPPTYNWALVGWFKPDTYDAGRESAGWDGTDDLYLYANDTTGSGGPRVFWRGLGSNILTSNIGSVAGSWSHLAVVSRASNDHELYRNAVSIATSSATGTAGPFSTFAVSPGSPTYDGMTDELWLLQAAPSAAWLTTEYNQTNDPASFATPGTPETVGGGALIAPVAMYYRRRRAA